MNNDEIPIENTIPMMTSFLRIHFARNEDVLEDLIPKLSKLDPTSPVSSSIKTILEDSGPCVCLFNRLIRNPRHHYQPSDLNLQARATELDMLYDILVKARKTLQTELEFQSLVAAIVAFHKRETDYSQIFNFFLTLTSDSNVVKDLLKFLNEKALHSYFPYLPDENSDDDDFSFDEISDVDPDLQPRMRVKETIPDILSKCDMKSDIALSLFLDGIISREDFVLVSPQLEHSKLIPDPIAIDSHNYVTQSLKRDEKKPNFEIFPRVQHSYRNSAHFIPVMPFSGASAKEELIQNRRYIATFTGLKESEKFAPGINIDADVSITSIDGACRILHEQEIDSDILYSATADIKMKHIHPGLTLSLSNIYGYQSDDIIDFLKSTFDEAEPVVVKTMAESITKLSLNYSKNMNDCYSRLTKELFRTFPHPEYIDECFDYLSKKLPPEKLYIITYLKELFENSDKENEVFEMSFWKTNLVTRFCLLYKFYIRKYRGHQYFRPILPLVNSSVNWYLAYEGLMNEHLKELNLYEFDNEDVKYPTPFIMKAIDSTIETICKDFSEPNFVDMKLNPELLTQNMKKVQFVHGMFFGVPVLKLNILPCAQIDLKIN